MSNYDEIKNLIRASRNAFNTNLNDNLRNVMSNNPNNTISISFRYYIDYNQAKKIF